MMFHCVVLRELNDDSFTAVLLSAVSVSEIEQSTIELLII